VKWADGIVAKAKDAEDTGGLLLQDVVDGLPAPVRDLIHHKPRTTYRELADAVCEVDGVMKHTKDEETARLTCMNSTSPTRAISESLANMYLQPDHTPRPYRPQQQIQSNFTDPFSNGGSRGSLFGPGRGTCSTYHRALGLVPSVWDAVCDRLPVRIHFVSDRFPSGTMTSSNSTS
jgi:hypothetical protein